LIGGGDNLDIKAGGQKPVVRIGKNGVPAVAATEKELVMNRIMQELTNRFSERTNTILRHLVMSGIGSDDEKVARAAREEMPPKEYQRLSALVADWRELPEEAPKQNLPSAPEDTEKAKKDKRKVTMQQAGASPSVLTGPWHRETKHGSFTSQGSTFPVPSRGVVSECPQSEQMSGRWLEPDRWEDGLADPGSVGVPRVDSYASQLMAAAFGAVVTKGSRSTKFWVLLPLFFATCCCSRLERRLLMGSMQT
jgi:hypothetical protein